MAEYLAKCPKCGGEAEIYAWGADYAVFCGGDCDFEDHIVVAPTKPDVIATWNKKYGKKEEKCKN